MPPDLLYDGIVHEAAELLTSLSIPLYSMDHRQQPMLRGSGFFVGNEGDNFLVSAAHVLDIMQAEPLFYYIDTGTTRKLSGKTILTPAPMGRSKDIVDVAVMHLEGSRQPPYPDIDKWRVPAGHIRPRLLPCSGRNYCLVGVPATRSRVHRPSREVRAFPFALIGRSIPDVDYATNKIDPRGHIAIRFYPNEAVDSDGRSSNPPKLQGLSGSPIWAMPAGTDGQFELVGVAIEHRKSSGLVVATDIAVALDMVRHLQRP